MRIAARRSGKCRLENFARKTPRGCARRSKMTERTYENLFKYDPAICVLLESFNVFSTSYSMRL